MLTQAIVKPKQIFDAAEEILEELHKISNLSLNKCFFCYKSLEKGKFTFVNKKGTIYSCNICIIRIALTQIIGKDNRMKEIDLAQILDLVTKSYIDLTI